MEKIQTNGKSVKTKIPIVKLQNHILHKKQGKWSPLLFSILFLVIQSSYSQIDSLALEHLTNKFEELSEKQVSDVVYLQTSKGIYETQEDVWFKGYVLDAKHFIPSTKSKVLFVQLINDKTSKPIWEEKYEIENGFVDGHIYLQDSLKAGNYTLAAYSSHSYFKNQKAFYALRKVKVLKSIQEKTILKIVKDTTLHFSLFPEGGHLVTGIQSRMAFKAVNVKGFPIETSGALYENDTVIVKFKSSHAGMGSFLFTPDHTKKYQVKLSAPKTTKTYNIPNIELRGKTLELLRITKDKAFFKIAQSANNPKETVYIRVQIRGEVQSIARTTLETERIIKIPLKDLPQGIAEVTLFNKELQPVAERLVYVHQDQDLHIKTVLDKSAYKTKEKVTLKLQVTNNANKPVIAHLGLSVYDKLYTNEQDTKTIQSHYYLSTQLKGNLYNPSYYFNKKNKNRKKALNLLLLTQGWRAYTWSEANLKTHPPNLPLITEIWKGSVTLEDKLQRPPNKGQIVVKIFTGDTLRGVNFIITDTSGGFEVGTRHLKMGEQAYLYMGAMVATKPKYVIKLKDTVFKTINTSRKTKINNHLFLNIEEETNKAPRSFILKPGVTKLDEVIVKGKKKRVFRDKYLGKLDSIVRRESWTYEPIGYKVLARTKRGTYFSVKGRKRVSNYSRMTEDELLKRFNLVMLKGYYGKKEFYSPVYDKVEQQQDFPDYRNTLFWKPDIITNEKGEATIEFYCSDINTKFLGIIEGVSGDGLLGSETLEFIVRK